MSDTTPSVSGASSRALIFCRTWPKRGRWHARHAGGAVELGAPTMSVEELDKRIQELKAVQFWLEQNARAITATVVQALEVQKMTPATLQGMNVAMGDMVPLVPRNRSRHRPSQRRTRATARASGHRRQPQRPRVRKPHRLRPTRRRPRRRACRSDAMVGSVDQPVSAQLAANAMKDAGTHHAAFEATREMASGR